jgi:hypothetical protein
MMLFENLKMALVSLRNAKLRSFPHHARHHHWRQCRCIHPGHTDKALKKPVQDQITGVVNANAIAVASGKINVGKSSGAQGGASSWAPPPLTNKTIDALAKVNHITAVAPNSLVSGIIANGTATSGGALLLATTPDFAKTQTLKFSGGRFLEPSDQRQRRGRAGRPTKQDLFGDTEPIGKNRHHPRHCVYCMWAPSKPPTPAPPASPAPVSTMPPTFPLTPPKPSRAAHPKFCAHRPNRCPASNVPATTDAAKAALPHLARPAREDLYGSSPPKDNLSHHRCRA